MNSTLKQYLPAVGSVVVVLLTALVAAFTDDRVTVPELVVVVIAGLNALLTYIVPNVPGAPWLKIVVTAVLAAVNALQGYLTDGLTTREILLVLVAGIGSTGVVAATNRFAPVHVPVQAGGNVPPGNYTTAGLAQAVKANETRTYGTDVSPTGEKGAVNNSLLVTVVLVLLAVALVVWILNAT